MGLKDFLFIDIKDWSNYLAILLAIALFWWGIKTILSVVK